MNQLSSNIGRTTSDSDRLYRAIEWLLIGLVVFMPLAFGVVHNWSKEIVIIFSSAIIILFLLRLVLQPDQPVIWHTAYVPIAAFILIGTIQLIPLPQSLVNLVSPNTVAVKTHLLADVPDARLDWLTVTFYSYATRHDLRLVLSVAAVFFVVVNIFRTSNQIKKLLLAVALAGGLVSLITLAQNLFGNGKIYWVIPTRYGNGYSGPFVNHSNFGQFMNLSVGAAVAYLCVKLHEEFLHKKVSSLNLLSYFAGKSADVFWLLTAVAVLGITAIFVSLTRGGIISMLIAMIFTTIVIISRRTLKSHGWMMILLALIAFICILYVGFDAVYDRLATLRNFHEAQSGRIQILKDVAVSVSDFPLLGVGLGTHSVVYPMFDRSTIAALAAYAENEYAQVLEETGIIGFGILVIFGLIIGKSYIKSIRSGDSPISSATYGLGFGLIAILIHSLSDFGQHLPANGFLSAIFCAIILVLSQQKQPVQSNCLPVTCGNRKIIRTIALLTTLCVCLWAFVDANNARRAEADWRKTLKAEKCLIDKDWQAEQSVYDDLISRASAVAAIEPQNVNYGYWLSVYKWRELSRSIDPDTRSVVINEDSMNIVHDIINRLNKISALCPTYGPIYCLAGQIQLFILGDEGGAEKIRKGFRVSSCDPMACLLAGYLDVRENKTEDAVSKFERAVKLNDGLFKDVANMYIYSLNHPKLAIKAAGDNVNHLSYVATALQDMLYTDLAEQTLEKIKTLLEQKCLTPQASAVAFENLACIYARGNNTKQAIDCYYRALALDYGQVSWHLDLAKLFAKTNQIPQAVQEAKVCLRLRPGYKPAEEFIASLSANPHAFIENAKWP